ncbi:MAG TPA: glycosyltransferase [Ktedonobacteraceae bacterium]|nr:glycosyltransferase [Ktedonobacteraceae bacterium]
MIETSELHYRETIEVLNPVQSYHNEQDADSQHDPGRKRWIGQVLRFGLVGGLNTIVDLLILNMLLLLFPTSSTRMILIYSAIAYSLGAVNSFLLNKYWTFGYRQRTTWREVVRFIVTTLCGIGWSSIILWLASNALHPLLINTTIWANASKVIAISGTALISYLGMSLWVFVNKARKEQTQFNTPVPASVPTQPYTPPAPTRYGTKEALLEGQRLNASSGYEQSGAIEYENEPTRSHSMSVVLPAYNEEQVIANTVFEVLHVLNAWCIDFEILVVNDGSTDQTGEIVEALTGAHSRVRLITHATNEGYGASLVSGFAAATKELVFFMDTDGQFDIRDLQKFFPLIDTYDAVIGYRIDRQDSWMRKLNAWGWKQLIGWVLGVHVRDVDCAFKLLHTEFLRRHPLETRGAMINAELLYRLKRAGCTYKEIGVNHLPRLHGRATGARLSVILRAFRELFMSAREWHRQEQRLAMQRAKRELPTGS